MFRLPSMDVVAGLMREAAAQFVLPRFRALAQGEVHEKAPGELVTIADHEAEAWLTPQLAALAPGSRVVGEEAAAANPKLLDGLDQDAVWLLDPLDGTSNFVRGREDFAMLLSLVHRGLTVAAWLYAPLRDELMQAQAGAGAYLGDQRLQLPTASTDTLHGLAKTYYMPAPLRTALTPVASGPFTLSDSTGATGRDYPAFIQGHWQFMALWRLLPWDHAPGALLVTEAGGVVARLDGRHYRAADTSHGLLVADSRDTWECVRAQLPANC